MASKQLLHKNKTKTTASVVIDVTNVLFNVSLIDLLTILFFLDLIIY